MRRLLSLAFTALLLLGRDERVSHTIGRDQLPVYLVDPGIEERLTTARVNPLTAEEHDRLTRGVAREVASGLGPYQVVLTTMGARRQFWVEVHQEFPRVVAIAYQELDALVDIQPISRIAYL